MAKIIGTTPTVFIGDKKLEGCTFTGAITIKEVPEQCECISAIKPIQASVTFTPGPHFCFSLSGIMIEQDLPRWIKDGRGAVAFGLADCWHKFVESIRRITGKDVDDCEF